MTEPAAEAVARARELLLRARRVLVLTGAGISADSGVPTFRGEEGLWKRHRPEELASPAAFRRDPRLVWEWYGWRRELVAACEPNEAHLALAEWSRRREGVRIVTQNVDGLHGEAARRVGGGAPSSDAPAAARPVLELHGSLFRIRCTACDARRTHRDPIDATSGATLPRCRRCGELLRPDVVWFGESLPSDVLEAAFAAAGRAEACLVVGTSAAVQPAAGLAVAAAENGASLVEVNPEPTPLTPLCAESLRATAVPAVPDLVRAG